MDVLTEGETGRYGMNIAVTDVKEVVRRMSGIIVENEVYFCELDSVAGDGDFGMSLSKGFREILSRIDGMDEESVHKFLRGCAMIISEFCGGASGPIWGAAFSAAASSVKGRDVSGTADVAGMFSAAVSAIQARGGAGSGDKTLLDALIPAAEALEEAAAQGIGLKEAFAEAAEAAEAGAERTKDMVASKGRAAYLGERSIGSPDAGAVAVALLFRRLTEER
jgi:dihydroxyacetone kinase